MMRVFSTLMFAVPVMMFVTACGVRGTESSSSPLVTDVRHSEVKRQSIGNCWLYATASWAESLHMSATQDEVNLSETYWTWWHWHNELVGSSGDKIQTGGNWWDAMEIIREHGYMIEGDFVVDEATAEMSARQARAESYINTQLARGGKLARVSDRTDRNVRHELDIAFGTDMVAAESKIHPASDLSVTSPAGSDNTTLDVATSQWQNVSYPRLYGNNATETAQVRQARRTLQQRVMRALNDRLPVVMSFMVDFNALDTSDATFKLSALQAAGGPGRQGGHLVVLEDYTVDDVPGVGHIGEGEVSDELKTKALKGKLSTIVVKNSWGKNRPDRGLTDGYNRMEMSYLNAQLEWKNEASSSSSFFTTLTSFVVPAGY